MSTGRKFNLEITSIADNAHHFEVNKREERSSAVSADETISLRELGKLQFLFPDKALAEKLVEYARTGLSQHDHVPNPFRHEGTRIFLSALPEPLESLEYQIRSAVQSKINKKHGEKDRTVLVIDNRTSAFDAPDYRQAGGALQAFLDAAPFPEIWFYTGYCSDDDGNRAEFSFAPLKITADQSRMLREMIDCCGIDHQGRLVW